MTEKRDWDPPKSGVSTHGRSRIFVECPFCHGELTIYLWSFAGHGKKRCVCGAILYRNGITTREVPDAPA